MKKQIISLFAAAAISASLIIPPITANAADYNILYDMDTNAFSSGMTSNVVELDDGTKNSELTADPQNESNMVWRTKAVSTGNGMINLDLDLPANGEKYLQAEFDIYMDALGSFQAQMNDKRGWGNKAAALNLTASGDVSCASVSGAKYEAEKWYSFKLVLDIENTEYMLWMKERGRDEYRYLAEYKAANQSFTGFRLSLISGNTYAYLDNVVLSAVNSYDKSVHYEFNDVQTKTNQLYLNMGANCDAITWSQAAFDGEKALEGKLNATAAKQPYTADRIPSMDKVVIEARIGFDSRDDDGTLNSENLPKQFGIIPVFANGTGAKNVGDWRERTNGIKFNSTRYLDLEGRGLSKTAGEDTQKGYNLSDRKLYTVGYVYDKTNKLFKAYFITNHGETIVTDASTNTFVQEQRNLAGVQLWLRAENGNLNGKGYYDYLHIDEAEDFKPAEVSPQNGETGVRTDSSLNVTFNYVMDPDNIGTVVLTAADGTEVPVTISPTNGKTLIITPETALLKITEYTLKLSGTKDLFGRTMADTEIKFKTAGRLSHLSSGVYNIDPDENTVKVMPYTTADAVKQAITADEGYTAELRNADGEPVEGDTIITSGMSLCSLDAEGNIAESFDVDAEKLIKEDFESCDVQQFYYGKTNGLNDWGLSFPSVDKTRIYAEVVDDELAGKLMHIYSNGDVADSARQRMDCIYSPDISSSSIGTKFIMKVSVKLPDADDSICQLVSYKKKDGTDANLVQAFNFSQGRLYVFQTAVGEYAQNVWNNVVLCGDTETGQTDVYVNGSSIYSSINENIKSIDRFTQVRMAHHIPVADTVVESYLDNFELFGVGSFETALGTELSATLESDKYSVIENKICGYVGMTVKELKDNAVVSAGSTVSVLNADGSEAEDTAMASKGMKLVVTSKGGANTGYLLDIEHFEASDAKILVNGVSGLDKFADGTVSAMVDVANYSQTPASVTVVMAQYREDGSLMRVRVGENTVAKGSGTAEADMNVTDASNTVLKVLILKGMDSMEPIKPAVAMNAYGNEAIESVEFLYPNYVEKAVTFSFDDLHDGDVKIIEAMDKHGVKGTFNIVTNKLSKYEDGVIAARYANHEMANHSYSHPKMYLLEGESETVGSDTQDHMTIDEVKAEIARGQSDLKAMTGEEPAGFIWPYRNPYQRTDYNEILDYIKNETAIEYVRPTETTRSFAIPEDWYQWKTTCHQDEAEYFINKLIAEEQTGELKLLAVWGHAFEMDPSYAADNQNKVRYDDLDRIFALLDRDDIWKATNKDICLYVKAADAAVVDKENNKIVNNSDKDLFAVVNGSKVLIEAHSEYALQ